MRFVRVVLALVFGLAMAGPETHACPVHSAAPAHHQDGGHQQKAPAGHCTCPQACCPTGHTAALPVASTGVSAAQLPMLVVALAPAHIILLSPREHVLPFALAPPLL